MKEPRWKFQDGNGKESFPHGVEIGSWILFKRPQYSADHVYYDRLDRISGTGKAVETARNGWIEVDGIVLLEAVTRPNGQKV